MDYLTKVIAEGPWRRRGRPPTNPRVKLPFVVLMDAVERLCDDADDLEGLLVERGAAVPDDATCKEATKLVQAAILHVASAQRLLEGGPDATVSPDTVEPAGVSGGTPEPPRDAGPRPKRKEGQGE